MTASGTVSSQPRRRVSVVIAATILLMSVPASAFAQRQDTGHFRKGIFAGVEISAGFAAGKAHAIPGAHSGAGRNSGKGLMPDYAFGMFGGYRFRPQLAVAAGIEGSNSVVTGTTALPVFVRLRSDILDRRVSPMVQIDLGYAFQFAHSTRTTSELSFNAEPFPERYTSLGFSSSEEYINACIENLLKRHGPLSEEESVRLAAEERLRAANRLCCFPNGQRSYLPAEALDRLGCFSKDGFFGSLTAGVSIAVGGKQGKEQDRKRGRIAAGVSVGLAQYSHSIPLRKSDNGHVTMSVPASLPDGTPVIIARASLKDNPLRIDIRLRLSWEF